VVDEEDVAVVPMEVEAEDEDVTALLTTPSDVGMVMVVRRPAIRVRPELERLTRLTSIKVGVPILTFPMQRLVHPCRLVVEPGLLTRQDVVEEDVLLSLLTLRDADRFVLLMDVLRPVVLLRMFLLFTQMTNSTEKNTTNRIKTNSTVVKRNILRKICTTETILRNIKDTKKCIMLKKENRNLKKRPKTSKPIGLTNSDSERQPRSRQEKILLLKPSMKMWMPSSVMMFKLLLWKRLVKTFSRLPSVFPRRSKVKLGNDR
jgi:hypothetical protein